jgi:rhombotail lipoprotein
LVVGLAAGAAVFTLTGCVAWQVSQRGQGTSVMEYLYPEETKQVELGRVPELALPLRVGVAFVPPATRRSGGYGYASATTPTEQERAALVDKVAERFRALPYIGKVEHIPSAYLRPGGGFANLDQVRAMFGVDVIALVAYDQVQFTDQSLLSLAYWTVVGAYVVKGEHNDTQTLLDAVLYDIPSRALLFRAPGTSQVKASATAVGLETRLRADSAKGFDLATEDMIKNLEAELAAFRSRIKEQPERVQITHRPGYSGAGSFGVGLALMLTGALLWAGRKSHT